MKKPKREEVIRGYMLEAGYEPTDRQVQWAVAFCTPGRSFRDAIAAARKAGYPDPVQGGDMNFAEFGLVLHEFIRTEDTMALAVWQTVSEQLQATSVKIISHQGLVTDEVVQADNTARLAAARLGAEMLGMKAPDKSEITIFDPAERLRRAEERLRDGEL